MGRPPSPAEHVCIGAVSPLWCCASPTPPSHLPIVLRRTTAHPLQDDPTSVIMGRSLRELTELKEDVAAFVVGCMLGLRPGQVRCCCCWFGVLGEQQVKVKADVAAAT